MLLCIHIVNSNILCDVILDIVSKDERYCLSFEYLDLTNDAVSLHAWPLLPLEADSRTLGIAFDLTDVDGNIELKLGVLAMKSGNFTLIQFRGMSSPVDVGDVLILTIAKGREYLNISSGCQLKCIIMA